MVQVYVIHFVIDIGSVAAGNIANGKLASWNTLKTIKLQVCGQNDTYEAVNGYDLQQGQTDSVFNDNANTFVVKPILKYKHELEDGTGGIITETGGNVGIGTTSPSQEVDMEEVENTGTGRIRFTDTDTADSKGVVCWSFSVQYISFKISKGGATPDLTKTFT